MEEDFPWHDPALELEERLALAEAAPRPRKLMAAMAQLDCGQCGYICQTYAEALATGAETSAGLCVPGGKPTSKALKALLAEAAPAAAPVSVAKPAGPVGEAIGFLAAKRLTGDGSAKDVRQVVLDLAGSGLAYQPGDSLGVIVENDPALVDAVLAALGADDGAAADPRRGEGHRPAARPHHGPAGRRGAATRARRRCCASSRTATTMPSRRRPICWTC